MKNILITGGSSGIGFEMSRIWAKNGYNLFWVSNSLSELEKSKSILEDEVPEVHISFLEKDLTSEHAPQDIYDWIYSLGGLDILINNAGFGTYGYVNDISIDKELSMIQLNVIGLYKMTRIFLNDMIKQNKGTIINICSNSAFQPVPRMTTYAATKGFVYQFSRGLTEELNILKSNVHILTVCPAAISDTPFRDRLSSDVKTFSGLATTTAKEVANDTWKGFQKKKHFIVSGQKMRLLYSISWLLPYSLQQFLVKQETEKAV